MQLIGHDATLVGGEAPDRPVTVLRGALSAGLPSYDAVRAEHVPLLPGGSSCRACGFVYTDERVCPAVILARAGFADFADRVRVVPESDPDYTALCELTVAVQRLGARIEVIGANLTGAAPARTPRRTSRSFRTRDN